MNRWKRIFFRELQLGILWTQAETGHQYAPAKVYRKVPDSGQKNDCKWKNFTQEHSCVKSTPTAANSRMKSKAGRFEVILRSDNTSPFLAKKQSSGRIWLSPPRTLLWPNVDVSLFSSHNFPHKAAAEPPACNNESLYTTLCTRFTTWETLSVFSDDKSNCSNHRKFFLKTSAIISISLFCLGPRFNTALALPA